MRKMAELQLNVVGDPKSKTAILKQISQWEENLEKLHVELYRVRCYVSSLQGCELPNPKVSCVFVFVGAGVVVFTSCCPAEKYTI